MLSSWVNPRNFYGPWLLCGYVMIFPPSSGNFPATKADSGAAAGECAAGDGHLWLDLTKFSREHKSPVDQSPLVDKNKHEKHQSFCL